MKKVTALLSMVFLSCAFVLSAEDTNDLPKQENVVHDESNAWTTHSHEDSEGFTYYFELPSTTVIEREDENGDMNDGTEESYELIAKDLANPSIYYVDIISGENKNWRSLGWLEKFYVEEVLGLAMAHYEETVTNQGYPAVDITYSHPILDMHYKARKILIKDGITAALGTIYTGDTHHYGHLLQSFRAKQEQPELTN